MVLDELFDDVRRAVRTAIGHDDNLVPFEALEQIAMNRHDVRRDNLRLLVAGDDDGYFLIFHITSLPAGPGDLLMIV